MGHGKLAGSITSALELIMGSQSNYEVVDFPAESNKEDLKTRFKFALERLKGTEQIVILTDLFNGTPFNIALEVARNNPKIKLYYGLNLGMLMELVSRRMFHGNLNCNGELVEIGRKHIGMFNPQTMEIYREVGEDDL